VRKIDSPTLSLPGVPTLEVSVPIIVSSPILNRVDGDKRSSELFSPPPRATHILVCSEVRLLVSLLRDLFPVASFFLSFVQAYLFLRAEN